MGPPPTHAHTSSNGELCDIATNVLSISQRISNHGMDAWNEAMATALIAESYYVECGKYWWKAEISLPEHTILTATH